jgi:hypothetical protein
MSQNPKPDLLNCMSSKPGAGHSQKNMNTMYTAGLRFERKISVGDLLTSISIVVAALGLFWQLAKDHDLARQKQANEIRSAAAKTLAAIERWRDVSLLIFEQGQPLFVETSERVKTANDIQAARDYLYKSLRSAHLRVQEKLSDERIETAYVELFKFHPSMRGYFSKVVFDLQNAEQQMFIGLLFETESAVLTIDAKVVNANSAVLGNSLRARADKVREDYLVSSSSALKPAAEFLSTLILKTDRELLDQTNLIAP